MARTRSTKDTPGSFSDKSHSTEDDWVDDDPMDVDLEASHSQINKHQENPHNPENGDNQDSDDDNEEASLARLSQQYRRFSESSRFHQESDDDYDEEEDDDDMVISIHQAQHDHDDEEDEEDDINDSNNNDDRSEINDDDDDDDDDENNMRHSDLFENTLRSFASRLAGNGHNSDRHDGNSLAENMARMFPEALGLFEGLGGSSGSNIRGLIDGLQRRDDSYLVLETLNELSSRLLMMNDLMAERGIPEESLSSALVNILNEPLFAEELELQLVACRCLYNFLEINTEYVHSVVRAGAIEALQSKLLEISFIDLAEQALQTLELISKHAGTKIFRKNCLASCLQYLDFFTIHAQRKAVNITANSVKFIKPSEFHLVEEILPTLQRIVLEYTDTQETEKAWLAISRIIKNFRTNNLLEKLVNIDLLKKIVSVISNSDTSLSTNLRLINTLSICAGNKKLASLILESGELINSLGLALSKYKKDASNSDSSISIEVLMAAPKDLILSILNLLVTILPVEPNSILTYSRGSKRDYSDIYDSYKDFVNDIFPLLINIYQSSVAFEIRRYVIVCLIRSSYSLKSINDLTDNSSITSLLASIVIQNKSIIRVDSTNVSSHINLLGALLVTQSFIEKDSEKFITEFEREGLLSDTSALLEVLRAEEHSFSEAELEEEDDDNDEEDSQEDDDEDDDDNHNNRFDEDDDDSERDYDDDSDLASRTFSSSSIKFGSSIFKTLSVATLLKHLTKCASNIEQIYLSKKATGSSKLEHLRLLDELNADLINEQLTESYSFDDWLGIWKNFQNSIFHGPSVISSFELISSGIIDVLFDLFSKRKYGSEGCICRNSFLQVFQGESFEFLIKKLQEVLTRSELFEIIGCGLKTGDNKVASLGKQLKVKLVVVDDEDNFFNGLSQFVILVHAIAGFSNISTFLKKRSEVPMLFGGSRNIQRSSNSSNWHVEFLLDDEVVPADTTIYGALYKHEYNKNPKFDTSRFWNEIHEIKFRKVNTAEPLMELDDRYPESSESDFEIKQHVKTVGILNLLKRLHEFNDKSDSFHNFKLTAKLNRQLEEPLIVASGVLPPWSIHITRKYPFLFPLETRIFFLQSTSFGYSRLVQLWNTRVNQDDKSSDSENNNTISLGRPTRYKVRVSRNHLLQSAYKVMEKLGSNPALLEIEFNEEVGTGLGPTLEFYSNVSHQFSKNKLGIWRTDETDKESEYVNLKNGLFPCPINEAVEDHSLKIEHFKYLGKFVARALLDNRIVDLNFNKMFFELAALEVADQSYALPKNIAFEKIRYIDEGLYKSLKYLKENKSNVEELSITYILPGYPTIELKPNGGEIYVNESNVEEYIDKVVDYTIGSGIKEQIQTFIAGFSEVFPFYSLLIFSPTELVQLLGKSEEDWSYRTLVSVIHADHGYSLDSPPVQNLLTTMANFNAQQRRLFLQFLTGSPRLPIGGFKNLKPEFTVVLKHSEDGLKPDDYLPSVMTCANYLKLPNYSTLETLQQRLDQAVNEGAGAFLLS